MQPKQAKKKQNKKKTCSLDQIVPQHLQHYKKISQLTNDRNVKQLCLALLTSLCVVNRVVSIFCRRGQAPEAESEDQKGKVPPPPPGSHDGSSVGVKPEGGQSAPVRLQQDQTLLTGDGKEIQVKEGGLNGGKKIKKEIKKKGKKIQASPQYSQRNAAGLSLQGRGCQKLFLTTPDVWRATVWGNTRENTYEYMC